MVDKLPARAVFSWIVKGVSLEASQEARNWLAEKGYDWGKMGARPMARGHPGQPEKRSPPNCCWSAVDGGQVTVALEKEKMS